MGFKNILKKSSKKAVIKAGTNTKEDKSEDKSTLSLLFEKALTPLILPLKPLNVLTQEIRPLKRKKSNEDSISRKAKRLHLSDVSQAIANMYKKKQEKIQLKAFNFLEKNDSEIFKSPEQKYFSITEDVSFATNMTKRRESLYLIPSIEDVSSDDELSVKGSKKYLSSQMYFLEQNRHILKKVNNIRYREDVFRVASRITKDMPSYPDWVYENDHLENQDIRKVNVGGTTFWIFSEALQNLNNTKISNVLINHKSDDIPFFDRDPKCFNAILNFYRTGHLHTPPNTCLSLFDEELEFWGIKDFFIQPCCWSAFNCFKTATNTLKKYCEDIDKTYSFEYVSNSSFNRTRMELNSIFTTGSGSVMARWMSTLCTISIFLSVLGLIIGTTDAGRVDFATGGITSLTKNETVSNYFFRTKIASSLNYVDLFISGFFLIEFFARLTICPMRLEFFCDTLNWVDLIATSTSIFSILYMWNTTGGSIEGYVLILKLPRILRLFRLTKNLRSGMDAFTLTIKASAKELKLIFLMLFIAASVFGSLLFVVEMINEEKFTRSEVDNAFYGFWLALVTMSTVGYGEVVVRSNFGRIIATICILCGIILCQMPVPIFLQNFRIYQNQASARINHSKKSFISKSDPETLGKEEIIVDKTF